MDIAMITKEHNLQKMCIICASDYHLEMILLPYITQRIDKSKFIIFTENNLEKSVNILLKRVNLNKEIKEKIKSINWKNEDKIKELEKCKENMEIIINGNYEYIKKVKNDIKKYISDNTNIIDCFHIEDSNINLNEIVSKYKCVLNTQKI